MLGLAHSAVDLYRSYNTKMPVKYVRRGRKSYRRSRKAMPLATRRVTYQRPGAGGFRPKTFNIPRASIGTRFWPRMGKSPIPNRKNVILNYTTVLQGLSTTTGGVVGITHTFGLNACFDPDITGVGHQPMGWDQWAKFYGLYKVWKCDVKLRPMHFGTDRCFIAAKVKPSQDTSALAGYTYDAACEDANTAVKIVTQGGDDDENVIARSFYMSEIEGHNINDDNYGATVNGNPGNLIKLVLGCGQVDQADAGQLKCVVELNFHVMFYNKHTLPQS